MKLKKLLASVTAIALATSTMAFSAFATVTTGSNDCGGTHTWVNGSCTNTGSDSTNTCDATCDHDGTVTYTKTDAQHTPKCDVCGWTGTAANHSYTGGTCVCGATEAATPTIPSGTKKTLAKNTWEGGWNWQNADSVSVTGITNWSTTVEEAMEALDSVKFTFTVNGAISNGAAFDVSKLKYQGVLQTAGGLWKTYDATVSGSTVTINMGDIDDQLSSTSGAVNFAIAISSDSENSSDPIDVYISDITVAVNGSTVDTTSPVTGSASIEANDYWNQHDEPIANLIGDLNKATGVLKIAGSSPFKIAYNSASTGNWTQFGGDNGETSFTINISDIADVQISIINISANTLLNVTWAASIGGTVAPATPADPNASSGDSSSGGDTSNGGTTAPSAPEGDYKISISQTVTPSDGVTLVQIIASEYNLVPTDVITLTVTSGGTNVGLNAFDMGWGGWNGVWSENGTITATVQDLMDAIGATADTFQGFLAQCTNASGSVTFVLTVSGSGSSTPSNPSTPETPSLPVSNGTLPSLTVPANDATGSVMVDSITSSAADSVSFNLGSSTKLDKEVFEAIAAKGDVTVKFNVAGGAYWEINGANVTNAKAVDLGVRMNSNLIPEGKVSEFAGDKTTIQLSLRHNGDLGFTGVLNVPINKSYNGKYANLYYYNGGKFDFVGSSAITGGRAKFAFSHASNYLIVIDDYAYGEDVSSAAGMTETTTETNSTVPYVAVLVVIAAFGASAIVLKKRLSK